MELMLGAKNKKELAKIRKELSSFKLLEFHNQISKLSVLLLKEYYLSHNLQIADAMIAATSLVYDIPLFTQNKKDFRYIAGLDIYEASMARDTDV